MSEDDGSFIRIQAATGSEHVLRVTTKLTFDDVTTALRDKLHMDCPVKTLGIVATRQSNRITLPPPLLVRNVDVTYFKEFSVRFMYFCTYI